MKYILLIIPLVLCLVFLGFGIYINNIFNSPNSNSSEIITFKVDSGESLESISNKLQSSEVISNADLFQIYTRLNSNYSSFQAGIFRIAKNKTFAEVSELLKKPISNQISIKVSDGMRIDEVAAQIDNQIDALTCKLSDKDCFSEIAKNFDKDEFSNLVTNSKDSNLPSFIKQILPSEKSLEGFLYPDTYYFNSNVNASQVLQKILANFEAKFSSIYSESYNLQDQNLSFYEVMKLTSVVTRESSHKVEDDKLISGVLLNRLSQNYPLQCDTINHYHFKSWTYELTQANLKAQYPYNSYINTGLPPTPISNISLTTFQNSLNAENTDYFYFLADKTGLLHYSKTWAEHVDFINKYLK